IRSPMLGTRSHQNNRMRLDVCGLGDGRSLLELLLALDCDLGLRALVEAPRNLRDERAHGIGRAQSRMLLRAVEPVRTLDLDLVLAVPVLADICVTELGEHAEALVGVSEPWAARTVHSHVGRDLRDVRPLLLVANRTVAGLDLLPRLGVSLEDVLLRIPDSGAEVRVVAAFDAVVPPTRAFLLAVLPFGWRGTPRDQASLRR